jgi:hypothetical protein
VEITLITRIDNTTGMPGFAEAPEKIVVGRATEAVDGREMSVELRFEFGFGRGVSGTREEVLECVTDEAVDGDSHTIAGVL